MRRSFIPAVVALLSIGPAMALDIVDSAFEVTVERDGKSETQASLVVPFLPGQACYYWYLQTAEKGVEVTYTERLVLPRPPASFGDLSVVDEGALGPTTIEDDGRTAVTVRRDMTDQGWFGHGWCIVEGDPLGPSRIEVLIEGELVRAFDFTVVAPAPSDTQGGQGKTPESPRDRHRTDGF